MTASVITAPQLKRLQVLYTQFERHSLDCPGATRAARIQWASTVIGRPIASYKDLSLEEARHLIDRLQLTLGVQAPSKSPRRPRTRRDAEKAATEGRRDQIHTETTLVGPREIRMIERDLDRLGWDKTRLEAFLRSPRGPNKGSAVIRTLGEANRVHWALKRMMPGHRKPAKPTPQKEQAQKA